MKVKDFIYLFIKVHLYFFIAVFIIFGFIGVIVLLSDIIKR